MRIKEVTNGSVLLDLDPGECLMLAEACGIAGEHFTDPATCRTGALLAQAAGYLEALALLGAVTNYVVKTRDLLDEWNLPLVRRDYGITATVQEVAQ